MQEIYTVTVTIDAGEWSVQKKITLDLLCTSFLLSQLFSPSSSALKDLQKLETLPGSGTGQSV